MLNVGLLQVPPQLVDLRLPLLVEVDLGLSGSSGLLHSLLEVVKLPGEAASLLLGLGTSLDTDCINRILRKATVKQI